MARDVALYILGIYGKEIRGKALALRGSILEKASNDTRMAICNLLPQVGVTTVFIPTSDSEDEGNLIVINASPIEPKVAVPPELTSCIHLKDIIGTKISVAIIGGCSAGRVEDMRAVVEVLNVKFVHSKVTLIITHASAKIANEMEQMGVISILRSSGAVIMPPGFGPFPGKHFGVLSDVDVALTTIRNSPGRMGAKEAKIYLASPISVEKAAIEGEVC